LCPHTKQQQISVLLATVETKTDSREIRDDDNLMGLYGADRPLPVTK